MFKKYMDYRRKREQWLLALLDAPRAERIGGGRLQRRLARNIDALSAIERQQMRGFVATYRSAHFYIAAAKLIVAFSVAGATLHLLFPGWITWTRALVLTNALGFVMAMGLINVWFNYRKMAGRELRIIVWCALVTMLATLAVNATLTLFGVAQAPLTLEALGRNLALSGLLSVLVVALPIGLVSLWRNRQYESFTLQLQQEAERERLSRELSESQLRLLRAQIEPHFLFNTLGAVQQLAEAGAPRAAELTANLIAFLRASLAEMRSEQVSLASEFGLVQAYLQVMQVRLGAARLRYTLDLPPALAQASVPSMILLTLAENAIKHGIEPALRGGEVNVSARLDDGLLRLRMRDTGVGLGARHAGAEDTPGAHPGGPAGAGLGLRHVRERLRLADAERASLTLRNAAGDGDGDDVGQAGAVAEVTLPMKALCA